MRLVSLLDMIDSFLELTTPKQKSPSKPPD